LHEIPPRKGDRPRDERGTVTAEIDPAGPSPWRRRLARLANAGLSVFARSLQQATTLILTILAARYIAPAEYGVYTLSVIFVTLAQTLTYTGYFQFVVTQKGEEKSLLDTLFWLIAGLSTLSAVVLYLAAPALAAAFGAAEMEPVLRLFAYVQPFAAIAAWCSAVLMRQRRFRLNFSVMIAQNALALVGGVVLLVLWQSVYALVAFRYVRIVSGALFYLPLTGVLPGFAFSRALAVSATRYASALYGARSLNFFSRYGADLALGLVFSTAEAGLYRFGNRLATGALDVIVQPLVSFSLAQFGHANRTGRPFGPILVRFLGTMIVVLGVAAATVALIVAPLVEVAFQPAYLAAVGVTYALAARVVLNTGGALVEPTLAAAGRSGRAMGFAAAMAVVQLTAVVVAAPFGLVALAWTQAAGGLVTSIAGIWYVRQVTGVALDGLAPVLSKAAAIVGLYAAGALCLWLAAESDLGRDVTALVVFVAASGVLALLALALAAKVKAFYLSIFSD
jgi:O-antigen/teichoic acid export membrane protein